MAEVYLVDREFGLGITKAFVLKRVRDELRTDPVYVEAFNEEARLATLFEHDNVVGVVDFKSDPKGETYMVMPFVDGGTARSLQNRVPARVLAPFVVARLGRHVASGIEYVRSIRGTNGKL